MAADLIHISLFSGIEAVGLAGEYLDIRTVGHCEIDPYARAVIRTHWHGTVIWWDVRHITRRKVIKRLYRMGVLRRDPAFGPLIDLLSGGFPCQPHSLAGSRKASSDERDLWHEFARVIGEVRPRRILGENVPGLLSSEAGRFYGGILRDLAALGYAVVWHSYGAADVGAPHERQRVFIIGLSVRDLDHPDGRGRAGGGSSGVAPEPDRLGTPDGLSGPPGAGGREVADAESERVGAADLQAEPDRAHQVPAGGGAAAVADANNGRDQRAPPAVRAGGNAPDVRGQALADAAGGLRWAERSVAGRGSRAGPSESDRGCAPVADADSERGYGFRWPEWGGRVKPADGGQPLANPREPRSQRPGAPEPGSAGRGRRSDLPGAAHQPTAQPPELADAEGQGLAQSSGSRRHRGGPAQTGPQYRGALCRGAAGARRWVIKPVLGGAADGLPPWLDGSLWPSGPQSPQKAWEAPRVVAKVKDRVARLSSLGNAISPAQVVPVLLAIRDDLRGERGRSG